MWECCKSKPLEVGSCFWRGDSEHLCAVRCEGARQAGRLVQHSTHTTGRGAGSPRTGTSFARAAQPNFPGRWSCRNSTATASNPITCTPCAHSALCLSHRGVHSLSQVLQSWAPRVSSLWLYTGSCRMYTWHRSFEIKSSKTQGAAQRRPCKSHLYFLNCV